MLVLTRKSDESIRIGDDVVIKVIRTGKGTVKLGIEAPGDVRILRGELVETAAESIASDEEGDDDTFTFDDEEDEFALPMSVACGGYVALPVMS